MNFFIIFMGVSGCGKTTIGKMTAKTLGVPYYEGDEYHPQENVDKMSSGIPLDDDDREGWLQRLSDLIQEKLAEGESGVLSCSALKKKYRDRLNIDPERVHFIYLKGDYLLIQERIQVRKNHYMSPELLKSQFETLEEPEHILSLNIDQPPQTIVEQVLCYIKKISSKVQEIPADIN